MLSVPSFYSSAPCQDESNISVGFEIAIKLLAINQCKPECTYAIPKLKRARSAKSLSLGLTGPENQVKQSYEKHAIQLSLWFQREPTYCS